MGIIGSDGKEKAYSADEIRKAANEMRGYALIALHCAGSGHTGGTLSALDAVAALYLRVMKHKPSDPDWDGRDRLFFSAGHKAPAWYIPLGYCGYFDVRQTALLRKFGSPFCGHPDRNKCVGIEASCGSLGQGLGVACGVARGLKQKNSAAGVYVLLGDGELCEGSVWEAVMFAAHHQLDNLVLIVDSNKKSMLGYCNSILNLLPLEEKFAGFGWDVAAVDGHDVRAVQGQLRRFQAARQGRPKALVANTVKGKGVPLLEQDTLCHVRTLNAQEALAAMGEAE